MGIAINLVYMGTAQFAVPSLQKLFESGYKISGVITQPDKPGGRGQNLQASPVKRKAQDLQLSVYQPFTLKDENAKALFRALAPDIIVLVAYGKILPRWLIDLPKYRVVNLHGSLLPKYRGAAPIHWAIANGETETGVCTMQVDEGLDTGPVYLSDRVEIGANESVKQLSERLADMGSDLVLRTVEGIVGGKLHPEPQDNTIATHAPILKKRDGYIDWAQPAPRIHNRIRAFNPWPGAVTRFRGSLCKVLRSKVTDDAIGGLPGAIVQRKGSLAALCGGGSVLEIVEIQPANRKPVSGAEFVNGAHIQPDEKFEPVVDNDE